MIDHLTDLSLEPFPTIFKNLLSTFLDLENQVFEYMYQHWIVLNVNTLFHCNITRMQFEDWVFVLCACHIWL